MSVYYLFGIVALFVAIIVFYLIRLLSQYLKSLNNSINNSINNSLTSIVKQIDNQIDITHTLSTDMCHLRLNKKTQNKELYQLTRRGSKYICEIINQTHKKYYTTEYYEWDLTSRRIVKRQTAKYWCKYKTPSNSLTDDIISKLKEVN